MISFTHIAFLFACFVCYSAEVQTEAEVTTSEKKDASLEIPKDVGFLEYGDSMYMYTSSPDSKSIYLLKPQNPDETNQIGDGEKKRPLFFITLKVPRYISENQQEPQQSQPSSDFKEVVEIRKKRDVLAEEDVPASSKIGKLRRKRTYCHKCGGGGRGYGGYVAYVPVTFAVYPVYTTYTPYYGGGGGKGCNTCGKSYGHGGGGGGSYSFSSSSAMSSSGSWGYGK